MKKFPIVAIFALAFAGCGGAKQSSSQGASSDTYRVLLETTQGPVTIEVDRRLAPNGAKRFEELVESKMVPV